MATFIEVQTDAFANNVNLKKLSYAGVRRPYRGIEIKEDTYGIIKVMKSDGTEIPLVDAGGPNVPKETNSTGSGSKSQQERSGYTTTNNYSNFIIQQIQDARQEKQQILETFGDSYVFFFGERPRVLVVNGLLMNTLDFNWRTEFWYNYENVLRGTKLVEQDARIYLYWDDIVVEGYMIGATAREDASMPYHIPFSFQLFVTNHMYLSTIGSDDYPVTHAVNLRALSAEDTELYRQSIKAKEKAYNKYTYAAKDLRLQLQITEQARLAAHGSGASGFLSSDGGQKLMQSTGFLANALAVGINAQNLTFLSLVNRAFRARKVRLPKGISGQFSYSGPPQYANEPNPWAFGPKRKLPYRSKIRDNVDEYVRSTDTDTEVQLDNAAIERGRSANLYDLEKRVLSDLEKLGIDTVQHPGGSLLKNGNSLGGFGGVVTEASLLALGFSVSAGLAAAGLGAARTEAVGFSEL